jgi:DNA polymerase I
VILNCRRVIVYDTEYEIDPGGLPRLLCLVAYILDNRLNLIRVVGMWRGEFGTSPPFDIGPDVIVIAYSAWAELIISLVMGWRFPDRIFDLHTAFLSVSNILLPFDYNDTQKRPRKGLSDACRAYGIEGWENIDKPAMAKDIGEGRWRLYGRESVLRYCEEDVRASVELLKRLLKGCGRYRPADVDRVIHWSNDSAKAVAQIQARGMPIDMHLWNLVQENKTAVIQHLLRKFDPSYDSDHPIYTPDGEWSYARFEAWLCSVGAVGWPRLESGALDIDSDAFKMMEHLVPGVDRLHALRDSLGVIVKANLPIGPDGRNRPSLFPFCTATGRNAHCKSLFNAHAGMRSFMTFPTGKIGIYLDWRTQEVGVVAAQSGDPMLMSDYNGGDIYYALAKMCGLTDDPDRVRWKNSNYAVRQRMKALQLGINYGMGVASLARGLGRHPVVASVVIEQHKRRYPRFWEWRADRVNSAMLERQMDTVFGWPMYLSTSPNVRTLYNFPAQGNGAEMLRIAAVRLCEVGIIPNMLIHDGILLEVSTEEEIEHANAIMRWAGREVCGGFEIGVDEDQRLVGGARYRDKRPVAKEMWRTILEALRAVGALSERDAA